MDEFYGVDDTFEDIDVKEKKKELKERNESYSFRLLKDILKFLLEVIYYFFFIIFKFVKWAVLICVLAVVTVGAVIATDVIPKLDEYTRQAHLDIQDNPISDTMDSETSFIYDKDGSLIVKLSSGEEKKTVSYRQLPENVVNAMVAVEDRKFFTHSGVDLKGIVRIMYNYVTSGGDDVAGASTITQQLMRNSYLTKEVTLERKLKEICYSLAYEEYYNKQEIFEKYINNIYFGNGFYGIEAASEGYFDKEISECSLSEIAYLCALPNRPNYYNPFNDKYKAYERRNKILNDMETCGYITTEEKEEALNTDIEIVGRDEDKYTNTFANAFSSYATYCATEKLMELGGFEFEYSWDSMDAYEEYKNNYNEEYEIYLEKLKRGGYEVYTSLDKEAQEIVQNALDSKLSALDNTIEEDGTYSLQGSITCIDNESGLVVAILAGRSQDDIVSYYNRGYQAYRQPGSSIKPLIVYLPALCNGFGANSTLTNMDIDKFKKTGEIVGQQYTLENSVIWSRNGSAYYLLNMIGAKTGLSYLEQMEFNRIVPDDYYLSSALGGLTYGTTTAEMASAYNSIYNNGNYNKNSCLISIKQGNREIYNVNNRNTVKIYNSEKCGTMISIMEKVISEGTARGIGWNSKLCSAAGKTGTTNDNKDGWFCGITPYYSMAVWVGYDNPKTLSNLQGGTYPAQIWKEAMQSLIETKINNGEKASGCTWKNISVYDSSEDGSIGSLSYISEEDMLPGRSDDELLSDGYTVGDYRADYTKANEAYEIINSMGNTLDDSKVQQVRDIISQIKGKTCKGKVESALETLITSATTSSVVSRTDENNGEDAGDAVSEGVSEGVDIDNIDVSQDIDNSTENMDNSNNYENSSTSTGNNMEGVNLGE
jgi:membrane peptidoglycan carboxypeptidase